MLNIGSSNGVFHKFYKSENDRFSESFLSLMKEPPANVLEIHLIDEAMADFMITLDSKIFSAFTFLSLHTPKFRYADNADTDRLLSKFEKIAEKFNIKNFIFHADEVDDWSFVTKKKISVSVENMDKNKKFGLVPSDIQPIIEKYGVSFTLDLQHCFSNDPTMKLADEFQNILGKRIVQYHISGFDEKLLHIPLFRSRQDIIVDSVRFRDKPIIVESVFDELGEQEKELNYVVDLLGEKI